MELPGYDAWLERDPISDINDRYVEAEARAEYESDVADSLNDEARWDENSGDRWEQ